MSDRTVGILLSDVAGYSNLSEAQLREYSTKIWQEITKHVIDSQPKHIIERNTWGDAIMLISDNPLQLVRLALKLRDFYKNKEWSRLGIEMDLSVRIALHVGTVSLDKNAILGKDDVSGTDMTVTARIEPITPPNTICVTEQFKTLVEGKDDIIVFDDLGDVTLAKGYGDRQLFHLRREGDKPLQGIKREIQIIPWRDDPRQRNTPTRKRLERCRPEEEVKLIIMVGKSLMLPEVRHAQKFVDETFPNALSRGIKFKGIVLDPEGEEARFRSNVESPGRLPEDRLLKRDASFLVRNLLLKYSSHKELKDKLQNLELKYTNIGLPFQLWLFEDVAFIRPYHFGKKEGHDILYGFCQLEIPESAIEYELMKKHFEVVWKNSRYVPWKNLEPEDSPDKTSSQGQKETPASSARARLLAVHESGPRLSDEDAEMLNRVIQEARNASISNELFA